MGVNATLLVELVLFIAFVWFVRARVWSAVTAVMTKREKQIAQGLRFADEQKKRLEQAEQESALLVREGQEKAQSIVAEAQLAAEKVLHDAREQASALRKKSIEDTDSLLARHRESALQTAVLELAGLSGEVLKKAFLGPEGRTAVLQKKVIEKYAREVAAHES